MGGFADVGCIERRCPLLLSLQPAGTSIGERAGPSPHGEGPARCAVSFRLLSRRRWVARTWLRMPLAPLTSHDREVLLAMATGLSNTEIVDLTGCMR